MLHFLQKAWAVVVEMVGALDNYQGYVLAVYNAFLLLGYTQTIKLSLIFFLVTTMKTS